MLNYVYFKSLTGQKTWVGSNCHEKKTIYIWSENVLKSGNSKLSPLGLRSRTYDFSISSAAWLQQAKTQRKTDCVDLSGRVVLCYQQTHFPILSKFVFGCEQKVPGTGNCTTLAAKAGSIGLYIIRFTLSQLKEQKRAWGGHEGGEGERKKWKENGSEIKLFSVPISSYKPKMAHYV